MMPADSDVLVRLLVEHWKVLRAFERTILRLPVEHRNRSAAQLNYSLGVLDTLVKEAGLRLVVFDGQIYSANMPATAVNAEDFAEGAALVVEQTVEPALIRDMTVIHFGRVLVALLPPLADDIDTPTPEGQNTVQAQSEEGQKASGPVTQ